MRTVPLAKPHITVSEIIAVQQVLESGWLTQGKQVQRFEACITDYVDARYGVAVNSCTSALHLALLAKGVVPGDEIICPSFSFIATANAIVHTGAIPVFVDIDEDTYNMDVAIVEAVIGRNTVGILAVDQFGLPCDINSLRKIADEEGLFLNEDAACALGAEVGDQKIGSIADVTCFSFHPRKIITTGEGGMAVTNEKKDADIMRCLRSHGASIDDRKRHTAKGRLYEDYPEIGYNYRMTDIHAAIGIEQLVKLDDLIEERQYLAKLYKDFLKDVEEVIVPNREGHIYQSYLIRLEDGIDRDEIIRFMADKGIATRRGIPPIHQQTAYVRRFGEQTHLPITEKCSKQTMFLPLFNSLAESELIYVVDTLKHALIHVDRT